MRILRHTAGKTLQQDTQWILPVHPFKLSNLTVRALDTQWILPVHPFKLSNLTVRALGHRDAHRMFWEEKLLLPSLLLIRLNASSLSTSRFERHAKGAAGKHTKGKHAKVQQTGQGDGQLADWRMGRPMGSLWVG